MEDKVEKKTRTQTGMALEVDVLKKMSHQLSRLPSMASKLRAADYVRNAATEGTLRADDDARKAATESTPATILAPPPAASDDF